jgi:phosphatidylglycerophosphate synthase
MTRRDWWLGVLAIVVVVLFHALFPRYEWREVTYSYASMLDLIDGLVARKSALTTHAAPAQ